MLTSFTLLLAFQQALWINVPFVQQDQNGCGSASIWMVMEYWKRGSAPPVEDIQQQLYSKSARGIYAKDMARYFEQHGYRVFAFRGQWQDLQQHVEKGRPLIVGAPMHYVVVAGIDPEHDLVLVNDPAQRKLMSIARDDFERDWKATNNWTLLAVPAVDLASRAFREENIEAAREHLTAAVRANPQDVYTNDFLATVYYLQDNSPAALKYWNRAGKPQVENIHIDPPLQLDPVLLDRAFAFSRGGQLKLANFETTQARLDALNIFSRYQIDLSPNGERFDVTLRAAERNGAGYLSWFRGLPFQTINPELSNLGGKAINIRSLLRWDPNKRRALVSLETPLNGTPKWGLRLTADGRQETWAGPAQDFQMRKLEAGAEIRAVPSGRWNWTSGAALSTRRFSNSFTSGLGLKYAGSITRSLIKQPESHFQLESSGRFEAGKLFTGDRTRFAKLEGRVSAKWHHLTSQVRFGRALGELPFDERFIVGLDRDSDIALRGHSATLDGRKNSSNTSRAYITSNTDLQRRIADFGWLHVTAGPFFDASKSALSTNWIADSGVEVRATVLGALTVQFSFGKSLSDPSHAFFLTIPK